MHLHIQLSGTDLAWCPGWSHGIEILRLPTVSSRAAVIFHTWFRLFFSCLKKLPTKNHLRMMLMLFCISLMSANPMERPKPAMCQSVSQFFSPSYCGVPTHSDPLLLLSSVWFFRVLFIRKTLELYDHEKYNDGRHACPLHNMSFLSLGSLNRTLGVTPQPNSQIKC